MFSLLSFSPSWLIMPRRGTPMRRRWKWPVFGWRYASALPVSSCVSLNDKQLLWGQCLVWFWFPSPQEKDLVPKLFKVLAPRFETQSNGYTRLARIPNRQNLDRAKMAVLEYKGNPFPPLYPAKKENELTIINQLLKGYREERAQQLSVKV